MSRSRKIPAARTAALHPEGGGNNFFTDVLVPTKLRNLIGNHVPATKKHVSTEDNARRLRGPKTDVNFMADVAAPVQIGRMVRMASGDANRRLQTAECFALSDGSIACLQEGFPGNGFYTVFMNCPAESPTVLDCSSCVIFGSSGEIDPENDPQCLSCTVCSEIVAFDCSNIGEGDCVIQTCSGDCSDGSGSSTPSPTPTPAVPTGGSSGGVLCQEDDTGSLFCVLEDSPADNWLTVFLDCPATTTNALQCGSCAILPPDGTPLEIDLVNDDQCSSCTVCSERVSWDCSNLDSGDCSVRDCSGICSSGGSQPTSPPPTNSPPTTAPPATTPAPPTDGESSSGGVSCQEDDTGSLFWVLEDSPADNWLTVFLDCPATVTSALQCGSCAILPPDGTPLEIDLVNDDQCSSCTVCSDTVSWDCSNLDGGDCSVRDCSGICSSGSTTSPPTTGPPTTGAPDPTPTGAPASTSPPIPLPNPTEVDERVDFSGGSTSMKNIGLFSLAASALGVVPLGLF